jgi:ubiquinone/menaquinone biosynthesis C-methylase UbiE
MDTVDDAYDYDEMDHSAVNRVFVDDFLAFCSQPSDVLDLGTGTAQIPLELCRRESSCRIMAADAAISMLELARININLADLSERIQLRHVDAKQLSFPDAFFDTVMSNSIVHHIPAPASVFAEAVRVCKPGGVLFFRDLLRPDHKLALDRLVETYTAGCNDHQRQMFADSLHAALTLDEVRGLIEPLGFARESVEQTSDRHWTWKARKV